jgi:proteasome alpha subunit
MTMPFYVSPEQLMKDRADYARKGIARGRSVVVLGYEGGIAFVAENPSRALHKVSEIYDRVAFAAVGKYNEFENLRVAGVRYADLRGYSYDRADVTARGLANAYAQTLGTVFTQESKPYEVEIAVAEVGTEPVDDQIYRLTYDGSVADEQGFVAMGGASEHISEGLKDRWHAGMTLADALSLAVELLAQDAGGGPSRTLPAGQLEVAVLDRERPRRTFRRIGGPLLDRLLSSEDPTTGVPREDEPTSGRRDTLSQDQQDGHAPTADPEGPVQPGPAQQ